jgi:hypothetical protein
MIKMTQRLLAGAVALALSDVCLAQDASPKPPDGASARLTSLVDEAFAQDSLPQALPGAPEVGSGGLLLKALPRPRDIPASMFTPPPPPSTEFLHVQAPYFERDRLLDGPTLQPAGWFTGLELQILKAHVQSGLSGTVANRAQKANGTSTLVALPTAALDWTVSPRVFLGYRLPSQFGEFLVAYRHLGTQGGGGVPGASGVLNSRLAFDIVDFDYNSRELSLYPGCDMKWTIGIRSLFMSFDSRFTQPSGQAAAGNGIFQARDSNNIAGVGPHVALQLLQHLGHSGWSLGLKTDFASIYHDSHVGYSTESTTLGPDGRPLFGQTTHFATQDSPTINVQAGLSWQPAPQSPSRFFLGYQYEHFWALDRLPPTGNNPPSVGQVWDQGIVLQATFRY